MFSFKFYSRELEHVAHNQRYAAYSLLQPRIQENLRVAIGLKFSGALFSTVLMAILLSPQLNGETPSGDYV